VPQPIAPLNSVVGRPTEEGRTDLSPMDRGPIWRARALPNGDQSDCLVIPCAQAHCAFFVRLPYIELRSLCQPCFLSSHLPYATLDHSVRALANQSCCSPFTLSSRRRLPVAPSRALYDSRSRSCRRVSASPPLWRTSVLTHLAWYAVHRPCCSFCECEMCLCRSMPFVSVVQLIVSMVC